LDEEAVVESWVENPCWRVPRTQARMPVELCIDPGKLNEWLVDNRLVLMYLPPYSPQLNLIEIAWKHLKYHWRRFVTWSKKELVEQVQYLKAGIG
jgi:transposase